MFSQIDQSWLFSIGSVGATIGTLPFGRYVIRYGFRHHFLILTSSLQDKNKIQFQK